MLVHFCVTEAINKLLQKYGTSRRVLEIPASEAGRLGVARVVRFMRRCCLPRGHHTCGELRIPHNLHIGIATIRACRIFGLDTDAGRIENLIVRKRMDSLTWSISKKHVELVWDSYFGALRETSFGDAIVRFVLKDVHRCKNASAEDIKQMLDLEEYATLNLRGRDETEAKMWEAESLDAFLQRCKAERIRKKENRRRVRLTDRESQVGIAQRDANNQGTTESLVTHDAVRPQQQSISRTSFGSGISSNTYAVPAAGVGLDLDKVSDSLPVLRKHMLTTAAASRIAFELREVIRLEPIDYAKQHITRRAFDTISLTE
jgi:hypothetical protein